jgi:hypothetical protein
MNAHVNTRRLVKYGVAPAFGALALAVVATGCGSDAAPESVVSGVVSSEASAAGTVSLKDSSAAARERTTRFDDTGAYVLDVNGLTPPFLLKAESTDGDRTVRLYSFSREGGRANINPITSAAVAGADEATEHGGDDVYARGDRERNRRMADGFQGLLTRLQDVLAPLFELYGVPADPFTAEGHTAELRALLHDVRFGVESGSVIVTNRETSGVIFSGPLSDLASGIFHAENLPGGPGAPPPDPVTCSAFTYSAWAACQPNNTQTRTVTASSPAGCTGGAPVTSQACSYVPPVTTCSAFTYSAWAACQPNNTQTRTVSSSSPAGCTGGAPVTSQACTYVPPACAYTYSAWSACSASGSQTRTVASSSPAGCAGTPVLTQSCTPPTQSCGTCHAIPPATGKHSRHTSFASCSTCHGSGYSTTTTNPATHQNGVKNVATTIGWNATSRSCANSCHGSRSW